MANTNANEISIKISALENNTFLYLEENISQLGRSIAKLGIDSLLSTGDLRAVLKIYELYTGTDKESFLTFSSSYCNWHNNIYPIFKSSTAKLIGQDDNIIDYKSYVKLLDDFREQYNLEVLDYRSLDKFLWIYCENFTA